MTREERIEMWTNRLERYANCDLTVADFCQQEQVSVANFYYWKRRIARRDQQTRLATMPLDDKTKTTSAIAKTRPQFAELVVNSQATSATAMLPGGVKLELGSDLQMAAMIVDRLLEHAERSHGSSPGGPNRC